MRTSPRQLGLSILALIAIAACGDSGGTGDTTEGCTPGATQACVCTNGTDGAQTCASDGQSFGQCECTAELANCDNDGVKEVGEECDDGDMDNTNGCTQACFFELKCGDGLVTGNEGCDDAGAKGNEFDICPDDCSVTTEGGGGAGGGGGGEGGMGGAPCNTDETVILAATVPAQTSVWAFEGLVGLDAGNAMCAEASLGTHVCSYAELLVAEAKADNLEPVLNGLAVGTTLWVHRDTPEMVNGSMSMPGAGGRCNDWTYPTNHISDGEYADITATSDLTFFLDNDTFFDGIDTTHTLPADLQCGGTIRAIPCCNLCVEPPAP